MRMISSIELTFAETAFTVTVRSPVDRPRARVVRLRRMAERNIVRG